MLEAARKFQDAEHYLIMNYDNIEVVNPMREVPYEKDKTWEQYMIEDISLLFGCDSIFMLRAMYVQIYNGHEQVLESKSYSTEKRALKWAESKLN